MSEPRCDFCSGGPVTWSYPALNFVAYVSDAIFGESVGAWAACDACHALIEASDRSGLTARAMRDLVRILPAGEATHELTAQMAALHDRFFAVRTGPARPLH